MFDINPAFCINTYTVVAFPQVVVGRSVGWSVVLAGAEVQASKLAQRDTLQFQYSRQIALFSRYIYP